MLREIRFAPMAKRNKMANCKQRVRLYMERDLWRWQHKKCRVSASVTSTNTSLESYSLTPRDKCVAVWAITGSKTGSKKGLKAVTHTSKDVGYGQKRLPHFFHLSSLTIPLFFFRRRTVSWQGAIKNYNRKVKKRKKNRSENK